MHTGSIEIVARPCKPNVLELSIRFEGVCPLHLSHQRTFERACFDSKRSGMPKATSEGRYWRSSPQSGHLTAMDLKGNSSTPAGTLLQHRLQPTTNCLRPRSGSRKAMRCNIAKKRTKCRGAFLQSSRIPIPRARKKMSKSVTRCSNALSSLCLFIAV